MKRIITLLVSVLLTMSSTVNAQTNIVVTDAGTLETKLAEGGITDTTTLTSLTIPDRSMVRTFNSCVTFRVVRIHISMQ